MWAKFKNWLIKKLGGYTKWEYDDLSLVTRYEVLSEQRKDIVQLRAEMSYDSFRTLPKEWVEDKLVGQLAEQMKPLVHWERSEDYCEMKIGVRAGVKVVGGNG